MGRTVGVIHATDKPDAEVEDSQIQDLTTLAKLAGARIGLLRVMAETQLQASTDTLTGLLNRRSFSEKVAAVPHDLYPVAVAMADLDHFKNLNDTYGHETGDRALRLFARVLRDSLRAHDLISRYGGEEFAIAFPDCSSVDATRALNTVQTQLDAAITVGGLPKFTSSFGITEIEPGEELAAVAAPGRRRALVGQALGTQPDRPARSRDGVERARDQRVHDPPGRGVAPRRAHLSRRPELVRRSCRAAHTGRDSVARMAAVPLRRNRNFVLLQAGQFLSNAGTQATSIAYPLLALALTHSAVKAGARLLRPHRPHRPAGHSRPAWRPTVGTVGR